VRFSFGSETAAIVAGYHHATRSPRELGGMIWIQIASAMVLLRLIIWVPFHLWRLRRERRIDY
jgi:hypothetical protein